MSPRAGGWWPSYDKGGGHRVPSARGPGSRRAFGRTWWGLAWVEALEGRARLDPNRLPRGRSYARSGAVGELGVAPGEVTAAVQGSRRTPYQVRVRVREFDDAEWGRLLDAVAAQVGHTASLLDGELPPEVVEDVAAAGLDLLPGPGELQPRCSCPDWADPCKHAAAVCYLVADTLDADPFALLLLRGRGRDQVLAGLRTRRAGGGGERPVVAHAVDPGVPAAAAFKGHAGPPTLPTVPLPPRRPGRPAPLGSDPPPDAGLDLSALTALAVDAATRAHELATGEGDGGLRLDRDADIARRAADCIGAPGFEPLARRAGLAGRELLRRALAWRHGGPAGLEVLSTPWSPSPDQMQEGVDTLGPGAAVWRNRVTRDERQLRLGRDGTWHPYRRSGGQWDPDGPPSGDPAALRSPSAT